MTYPFNPKEYATNELGELVLQRQKLEDALVIGDCLLRELAEQSSNGGPVLMLMELIGYRAAFDILRREFPDKFEGGLEHFRQICEHFPTDWGHLIEVETGKILDTYGKGNT